MGLTSLVLLTSLFAISSPPLSPKSSYGYIDDASAYDVDGTARLRRARNSTAVGVGLSWTGVGLGLAGAFTELGLDCGVDNCAGTTQRANRLYISSAVVTAAGVVTVGFGSLRVGTSNRIRDRRPAISTAAVAGIGTAGIGAGLLTTGVLTNSRWIGIWGASLIGAGVIVGHGTGLAALRVGSRALRESRPQVLILPAVGGGMQGLGVFVSW